MNKWTGLMTLVLGIALVAPVSAQRTWDGGAGTDEWTDANNWNPDGVPSAESANIAGVQVDLSGAAASITSLGIGGRTDPATAGTLNVQSGGSLSIGGYADNGGIINVTGGALTFASGGATIRPAHRAGSHERWTISSGTMTFDNSRIQSGSGEWDVTVSGTGGIVLTAAQTRGLGIVGLTAATSGDGVNTLSLSDSGTITSTNNDLGIGENPGDTPPSGGTGLLTMTGGSINLSGAGADLKIGRVGVSTGTANISAGAVTVGGNLTLGNSGSSLHISGTSSSVSIGGSYLVSGDADPTAVVTQFTAVAGGVTAIQAGSINLIANGSQSRLVVDLSSYDLANGDVVELFDYSGGIVTGTFGSVSVTGVTSYTLDYAYAGGTKIALTNLRGPANGMLFWQK